MNVFPGLAGNGGLKERIASILLSGSSPSHAYIAEGPKGSGRHTFALQYAAALNCDNLKSFGGGAPLPCGKCRNCRKIFAGICPDVITVGNDDKASLGVDKIRDLRSDVHIYPNELDYKIYIIEQADTMTVQAQNAFLLTLEEPPEYAVFLLLCENSGALLETVKSRAPVLRMQPLSPEEIGRVIADNMPEAGKIRAQDPERYNAAVMSASGSAGRALSLLGGSGGAEAAKVRAEAETFLELCSDPRKAADAMSELIKDCANSRDTASVFLNTLIPACRDLILLNRDSECTTVFFADRDRALELCDRFSIKKLLSLSTAAGNALTALGRGMNVRLTLMTMLSEGGII